jgi:hypothetical protein
MSPPINSVHAHQFDAVALCRMPGRQVRGVIIPHIVAASASP